MFPFPALQSAASNASENRIRNPRKHAAAGNSIDSASSLRHRTGCAVGGRANVQTQWINTKDLQVCAIVVRHADRNGMFACRGNSLDVHALNSSANRVSRSISAQQQQSIHPPPFQHAIKSQISNAKLVCNENAPDPISSGPLIPISEASLGPAFRPNTVQQISPFSASTQVWKSSRSDVLFVAHIRTYCSLLLKQTARSRFRDHLRLRSNCSG